MTPRYGMDDVVEMKRQHTCGTNRSRIIRMDTDIRVKYEGCQRSIMIPRRVFDKKIKKMSVSHQDTGG